MMFAKRLREGVRRGEITCSVRIWMRPHVKVGGRYRMEEGEIEVDSIETIGFPDITPELARRVGISRCSGSAQDRQARQRRKHLFSPLPLCATLPAQGSAIKPQSKGMMQEPSS